jgi:hypothetical protein
MLSTRRRRSGQTASGSSSLDRVLRRTMLGSERRSQRMRANSSPGRICPLQRQVREMEALS